MLAEGGSRKIPGRPMPLSPAQSTQMLGLHTTPPPEQPFSAAKEEQSVLYKACALSAC